MSETSTGGSAHVPSIIPALNPLMRRLLGRGLPFGPNVLLTVRGRASGAAHTFPVAILELHGRRFVQSPFGEVNWVRNLRVAGEAVVTAGGRQEVVEATEVAPADGAVILHDALAGYLRSRLAAPLVGRFFHLRPGSTAADYVAAARAHPMFELQAGARTQRRVVADPAGES